MAELTPITRLEMYLAKANGQDVPVPQAATRLEMYLRKIAGEEQDIPEPITRLEMFLAKIAGEDIETPVPVTRLEMFLDKATGGSYEDLVAITRLEMWLDGIQAGGGGEIKTITGNAPLTFEALAAALVSLTQDGKTVQDGTPTPDAPVDIVCNNGTLMMRHRSGLPKGYKLLDSVGSNGDAYVITNTYLASTDVVETEFRNSSTTGYGALYGIYKTGESTALYGNQTYYGYGQANNKVDTGMSVDTDWHSARHDFVNGTLTIDDATTTFTPWAFTNTTKNAVLSRFYNGSYGYNWRGFVRKFKVTRGNEVICDLLPAKDSNDVAGLYDLISGSFFVATGGTLLEGDVVDDYELIVDGTPEVLSLGTQTASVADLYAVGDSKDTHELIGGTVTHKVGVKVFDGTETISISNACFTIPISDRVTSKTALLCSHFPYSNKTSSQTEDQTIISFSSTNIGFRYDDCADKTAFAAWLKAQYAAGTPVIVLYPLATETTESVQGQRLHSASGDNTISVVSNVDPVTLTAEYKAEPEPEEVDEP